MLTTNTPSSAYEGRAISQNGNVIDVNWPAAQKLHAQKRAFVHKPLIKTHSPADLAKLQGFDFDGDGPEAA